MASNMNLVADNETITAAVIEDVCARLLANKRVRQPLPGGGMLEMDRMLPFLCIYRRDPNRRDEGTAQLVRSEASFLSAPGSSPDRGGLRTLVRRIAQTVSGQLGSFLLLEVWSGEDELHVDDTTGERQLPEPLFRIMPRRPHRPAGTVATLGHALKQIRVHRKSAIVEINREANNHPNGMKPLISERAEMSIGCHVLGLEVRPLYRDADSGEIYDRVMRSYNRQVSHAIKKTFFAFAQDRTTVRPEHYFSFGSSKLSSQVLAVDRQLSDLSHQFKFLLLVTPINAQRSWLDFSQGGYRKSPVFQYRPLDGDPMLLKRRVTKVATEKVEDPALSHIFRQTQYELDRQINMLADIGTSRFLHGSLQVYGNVQPRLRNLALKILRKSTTENQKGDQAEMLGSRAFFRLAEKEVDFYRKQCSAFTAKVTIRDDIYTGLMVTGGELLIGRESRLSKARAEALLQHEVGTHLVTYYNGAAQPLRLLRSGLADYDALQEGIAVLSEYLVGGLSMGRLRTLAARVVVADEVARGSSFCDVFERLVDEMRFEPRTAYTIALRVFRGGGLTKDALYLRGLVEILEYLGAGGEIEPLLLGKFAVEHVPIVRELTLCGVLRKPPLRPRYLDSPAALQRLKKIERGTTVIDLIDLQRV
ncbi:MAG: DUF1704 domain-containing protein [Pirellulaceae bacterium]|nr:DUF1704 domain-containing protein [Pirellulaceae bacterium]